MMYAMIQKINNNFDLDTPIKYLTKVMKLHVYQLELCLNCLLPLFLIEYSYFSK